MGGTFRAFLDASVLYPVSLRNLLMRLTLAGLYQARWSPHVHDEWIRSVLRDHPGIPPARLNDQLIDSLHLPDPNDRHVLAAAIIGRADVIVTRNLRDFPDEALFRYNMEAQHPDEFIRHMIDLAPVSVVDAVRSQQASLTNPPFSMPDLLSLFEKLGLAETAAELRHLLAV
jgi:hypothetical protein